MTLSKSDGPIYVCGPMSYRPKFNVPAFLEADLRLRNQGYLTQLPADLDDPKIVASLMASPDGDPNSNLTGGLTWGDCLAMDVKLISDICGGVAVLPGWHQSRGARLETFVAFLCGKPVVYAASLQKVKKKSLAKAWLGSYFE